MVDIKLRLVQSPKNREDWTKRSVTVVHNKPKLVIITHNKPKKHLQLVR